jgi:hypothetical protein
VNGPYNFVGNGDVGKWIATLEAAKQLGAEVICTGHGPRSVAAVLDDQQTYFKLLQDQVGAHIAEGSPEQVSAQIQTVWTALKANPRIARYVSGKDRADNGFREHVQKVYEELNGKKLAALLGDAHSARHAHARSHGVEIA